MGTTTELQDLRNYRTSAVLRDGATVSLRAIQRADEDRLLDFIRHMSGRAFLYPSGRAVAASREEARRLCDVDYESSFALVATAGSGTEEAIIGVGRYARSPEPGTAEAAVTVGDAYKGRGIGTILLEQLALVARRRAIRTFKTAVPASNEEAMKMVVTSGFGTTQELKDGVYHMTLDIAPSEAMEQTSAERERVAAIASLRAFLQPRSVAVIGASARENTIGNKLFRAVLQEGYRGTVYPVNPAAGAVAAVKAYPTVLDIPGEVDLAVIITPAAAVPGVMEQCGRKGVRGVIIISAGFGEMGPQGQERERRLARIASEHGMRIIGPNCMGVLNTASEVRLNATFSSVFPPSGRVAFCTQSGALGLAILEYARTLNIGLSSFVSIGNAADVNTNDLLQYWEQDPATDVILLYVESFGQPRDFARIARRVTAGKPVVAVKGGRTPAGFRAAASHTGALASSVGLYETLFKQAGIIRVDTLEELFNVAEVIVHQPVPRGKRVAILTNGGGPGILTADACAARGFEVPPLSRDTVAELRKILPERASFGNPVDMTAEVGGEEYAASLRLLCGDEAVDIVIVIFVPPVLVQAEVVAAAIREVSPLFRSRGKTLIASFMGTRGAAVELGSKEAGYVPSFTFPEEAADALAGARDYREWLTRPRGVQPRLEGIDRDRAGRIVKVALGAAPQRPFWLDTPSAIQLLDSYGIRFVPTRTATTAARAAQAAAEVGFPVAVKLLSRTIVHKTEAGGVILNLTSPGEVEEAFGTIKERLVAAGRAGDMDGVVVQPMAAGIECIVGVTQDPSFGPLILFGLGGIYAELFKDVTIRIHPLTDVDAREMVRSVKAYQLLEGWRGAPPSDVKALEELLLRVGAMVEDLPQIAEMDLNPVKVLERDRGYWVADVRISLA